MKIYMKDKYLKFIIFILVIYLLIYLLYLSYLSYYSYITIKESFLDTTYEKTIYLVWRNKKNKETSYGIGDRIRGALCLYQYCKKNKINLKIDATDDICGDYLKNIKSDSYNLIKNKDLLLLLWHSEYSEIKLNLDDELSKNNDIFVFCNNFPENELDNDDKNFAKYISQPNEILQLEIDNKIKQLPNNFGIQHFRFKDEVFTNDIDSNVPLFNNCFDLLKQNYKNTDVLLSNSNNFKKYAKEKLGIKTVDCDNELCKIAHSGDNDESVKNTLIEFYIIRNASYIKSYTCYDWESNFVKWPAKIYDIPFENVYLK